MLIKVTWDHIGRGEAHNCSNCPVALAIREATGRLCEVGWDFIDLWDPGEMRYNPFDDKPPPEVGKFARDFDNGEYVEPFEFELPID